MVPYHNIMHYYGTILDDTVLQMMMIILVLDDVQTKQKLPAQQQHVKVRYKSVPYLSSSSSSSNNNNSFIGALQYSTVQYSTVLYCTVLYSRVLVVVLRYYYVHIMYSTCVLFRTSILSMIIQYSMCDRMFFTACITRT